MTLRRKFILGLIGMVFFMTILFTVISITSTHALLGHAESYVQQAYGENWKRLLSVYYESRGGWEGVQGYVSKVTEAERRFGPMMEGMEGKQGYGLFVEGKTFVRIIPGSDQNLYLNRQHREIPRFWVFNLENKVVGDSLGRDLGKYLIQFPSNNKIAKQWEEIKVKDQTVGYYWQENPLTANNNRLAKTIGTSIIQAMLIGLILTSIVALLLGMLLTRHFTKPLNHLMEAVRKVGKGDLSSRVQVKGNGDIAILAQDFNRMTEQLARNEEVRRNMVADIAHELRTPLSVILGKLESIQEGVLPSTPETILPIQDETLRLIRLVRDLQHLNLAEAGKLPMALQPVKLRQLVERIIEQFAIEFEERELRTEILGEVPEIIADPDRLTQVFVNLIGNALLHTPVGGTLRVVLAEIDRFAEDETVTDGNSHRLRDVFRRIGERADKTDRTDRTDRTVKWVELNEIREKKEANPRKVYTGKDPLKFADWVQVSVEDSGEGIPEEELEHIFDRFYRIDKARERESGGTGLGLAIAKEFIQAHGGSIYVKSKLGEGSCFTILLPVKLSVNND
ncbi:ATP-binding protein [Desulfosporosinus sp.]|uniref:sensor histidine kinase n=1 Tax=Desulfosporosinus sp. TaxID=157907 RepID=UPI0025B9DFC7|nr:ATP-binding protein [Desulfosporosinus sp.]MBC2721720.1 HAMP domain-containing protein [Desulfosporosinus sp.]MBC2726330.1 HAMP domain-containing protein [Desulfosporosinus sp.]